MCERSIVHFQSRDQKLNARSRSFIIKIEENATDRMKIKRYNVKNTYYFGIIFDSRARSDFE